MERRIAVVVRGVNIETQREQVADRLDGLFIASLIIRRRGRTAVTPSESGGEQQRIGSTARHRDLWIRASGHKSAHHFNVSGFCRAKERCNALAQGVTPFL